MVFSCLPTEEGIVGRNIWRRQTAGPTLLCIALVLNFFYYVLQALSPLSRLCRSVHGWLHPGRDRELGVRFQLHRPVQPDRRHHICRLWERETDSVIAIIIIFFLFLK